jgi:hypothetical protein
MRATDVIIWQQTMTSICLNEYDEMMDLLNRMMAIETAAAIDN